MCKYLIKVCLLHNRIRDWCNPPQPLPRQGRQRETRMTKKTRIIPYPGVASQSVLRFLRFRCIFSADIGDIGAILWPAIAIVVTIGTIYCIFPGVKISKADEQDSGEKAKKDLVGAVIGFVLIFVLILALKITVPILEDWVKF